MELDHRAWGEGRSLSGLTTALQYLAEQWRPRTWNRTSSLPVYVSTTDALTVDQVEEVGSNRTTDAMFLHTMSAAGITTEVYAPSMSVWRLRTRSSEPFPLRTGLATCAEMAECFEALTGAPPANDIPCTAPSGEDAFVE